MGSNTTQFFIKYVGRIIIDFTFCCW